MNLDKPSVDNKMVATTTAYYYDTHNRRVPVTLPDQDWESATSPLEVLDGVAKTDICLEFPDRLKMLIGGGGNHYVVTVIGDYFGPYQLLGSIRSDHTVRVRFGGVDSDMPSRYVVTREQALHAARYFRSSLGLTPDMEWESC